MVNSVPVRTVRSGVVWCGLCGVSSDHAFIMKAYDFANVNPCDNKAKIYTLLKLKVKFADSIATDTNGVQ